MPRYQYACTECGHDFEATQSFTDDPLTECPNCSGRLRKVFSSVGVVFKGSGFYRTDSRDASGKSKASTSSSESKDSKPAESTSSSSDSTSSGSADSSSGKATTPAAAPKSTGESAA